MKKTTIIRTVFFLIFMLVTACLYSQVTIGSGTSPAKGAILDLKTKEGAAGTATTDEQGGGLLLPRVNLESITSLKPFAVADTDDTERLNHKGLVVYNLTNDTNFNPGIYTWNGAQWETLQNPSTGTNSYLGIDPIAINNNEISLLDGGVKTVKIADSNVTTAKIANNSVTNAKLAPAGTSGQVLTSQGTSINPVWATMNVNDADYIVGNEVIGATANAGLVRAGSGTAASPYTLGIATSGVTTDKIAYSAITTDKITTGAVTTVKIANSAVSTDKIINNAVTLDKFAKGGNSGDILVSNGSSVNASWMAPASARML